MDEPVRGTIFNGVVGSAAGGFAAGFDAPADAARLLSCAAAEGPLLLVRAVGDVCFFLTTLAGEAGRAAAGGEEDALLL